MPVAPSSLPHPSSASSTRLTESAPAWMDQDLQGRIDRAALATGMTPAAVCEQWVREGLERFEAQRPIEDPDGSGRCSLRTGTCTVGPVPLPVQQ